MNVTAGAAASELREPVTEMAPPYMVTVIVPIYNPGGQLDEQLESLTQQEFAGTWEVVLADNGTTDGSLDNLGAFAGRLNLRVVDASARRGPSFARNLAAEVARGEWLAFCDADDITAPDWLSRLFAARCSGDLISGVYEVERLNTPAVIAARAGVDYWKDLLRGPADFLPFAPSGNFMMRRDVYLEMGGFDETVPGPGGEDVDLSWRVQLSGRTLVLAPGAVVHYRFRGTPRSVYRQVRGYKLAEAELYVRYRDMGMRRQSVGKAASRIWWLVSRLPYLALAGHRRLTWSAVAGEVVGRVRGSIDRRVLYP